MTRDQHFADLALRGFRFVEHRVIPSGAMVLIGPRPIRGTKTYSAARLTLGSKWVACVYRVWEEDIGDEFSPASFGLPPVPEDIQVWLSHD